MDVPDYHVILHQVFFNAGIEIKSVGGELGKDKVIRLQLVDFLEICLIFGFFVRSVSSIIRLVAALKSWLWTAYSATTSRNVVPIRMVPFCYSQMHHF